MSSFTGEVNVYVKTAKVKHYQFSSTATVQQLYQALGYKIEQYDDYLVTIGKERIEGFIRLCNIVTSEIQPLTITCFACWVQFEDDVPLLKFCSPTTAIVRLQGNDRPNMAFHKRERVDIQLPIWSLFTSEEEPLIF